MVGTLFYPHGARAVLLSRTPHLSGAVEEGDLELFLLRPMPTPVPLAPHRSPDEASLGIGVLWYGISLVPGIEPWRFAPFCVSLVLSLAIYGTMVFCLLCLSFWLIKMRNFFWLIYDLAEFAKYPAGVCRGAIRVLFSPRCSRWYSSSTSR